MAKITMIAAQQRPGRYNVYLNGRFAIAVAESVLVKYRLSRGMEIDDQLLAALKADDRVAKAYARMLDYLAHQLRTEKEVRQKMQQLGFEDELIDRVVAKLTADKLLDDANYAGSYVRTAMRTSLKGPRVIKQKLLQKGVSADVADEALLQFTHEQQVTAATKLSQKLFRRYQRQPQQRKVQKVEQGLVTNGFSFDIFNEIKEEVIPEVDENQQDALLDREASRAWRRYRHEKGYARKMKLERHLFAKGFQLDEINRWLDEHDNDY